MRARLASATLLLCCSLRFASAASANEYGLTDEGNAEFRSCEKTVRAAARDLVPKIFYATHGSDRLIFEDALNAKVRLALAPLVRYPADLCRLAYENEFKRVYWELDHGVWQMNAHKKGVRAGQRLEATATDKDSACPVAKKVKGIVAELGPSAYYASDKEKHEEEKLRMVFRISKLLFASNLSEDQKNICMDVGMAAYQNFAKGAEAADRR